MLILSPLGDEHMAELKASLRQIIAMHEPPGGIALADLDGA